LGHAGIERAEWNLEIIWISRRSGLSSLSGIDARSTTLPAGAGLVYGGLKTLAELHAIIQAIEYERYSGAGMVAENGVKAEVDG
jgi:hypothetical protein